LTINNNVFPKQYPKNQNSTKSGENFKTIWEESANSAWPFSLIRERALGPKIIAMLGNQNPKVKVNFGENCLILNIKN